MSVYESYQLDSPSPDAAQSGLHLLSCPHLFKKDNSDETDEYRNLHLSPEAGKKLIETLKASLQHARVVHTGKKGEHKKGYVPSLSKAISDKLKLDEDEVVDVNVPRRADNRNLCTVLEDIVKEHPLDASNTDSKVSISIVKLDRRSSETPLLRGARAIMESPIIDNIVMRFSNARESIGETVSRVIPSAEVFQAPFGEKTKSSTAVA
jgi:hypothetical protein